MEVIIIENFDYPLEELIPVVAELAAGYSGCEHSSITYEKAEMLMEAVLYCIGECKNSNDNALLFNHIPAKEMYLSGQKILMEKVRKLGEIYNELILDFEDYGSACLKNTIVKEIPKFLLRYDVKYAPQETLLALDYPVFKDLRALSGVNAVLEYVTCIYLEQKFLKKFDGAYVIEILRAYHDDYKVLVENICHIVLQNTIGHMILDKPLYYKGFSKKDFEKAGDILLQKSEKEMKRYIAQMLQFLTERYYDNDILLADYLNCDVSDIVRRIQCNLKNHCLDKVFLI